jgi:phenylalanyl-tRNA synthetase beta chain
VQQHPNADRLTLPTVSYGDGRSLTLVTGAPNVKVGMQGQKVALALTGAKLIDGHSDTRRWLTLKPGKIRGVVSEGMVCSEMELGLSDEHEGILFLPDDAPVGMPLRDYLGDVVLDAYITPDKAYASSIVGMAREIAALTGQPLHLPEPRVVAEGPSIEGNVQVTVENGDDCPRFTAGLIEGVEIGPSPAWLQQRLRLCGMRPISNIVDVTNYVMIEWGQPSHAFDADTVQDRHLIVRRAHNGEKLTTLDGKERVLNGEIGDFVTIARKDRRSENWYLGAVTDEEGRVLETPLSFLTPGRRYRAQIYRDGPNAHYRTNGKDIVIEERTFTSADTLTLRLAPGGGQAIRFVAGR